MRTRNPHNTALPKTYEGYSTKELLKIWEQIQGEGIPKDVPREKVVAMGKFLNEYKLTPESRA